MLRHPRLTLLVVLVLILAVLGIRALGAQTQPADSRPPTTSAAVHAAADASRELRLIVSVARRRLWVVSDSADTLLSTPVAVGSGKALRAGSSVWRFTTPRGIRTVISKEIDPVWIRPDWAYIEVARELQLRIDSVSTHRPRPLPEGAILTLRDATVGVLSADSTFEPCPLDEEIVFGHTLYIPPIGSANRAVHGTLGKYRLNLGDGIGLHGTPDETSIGRAVTHGCLRMAAEPLEWVYNNIPIGTKVYIY